MPKEYEEIKASLRKKYPKLSDEELSTRASRIFGSIFGTNPQHAHQLESQGEWEAYKKSHSTKEFNADEIFKLDFQSLELKEEDGEFYVETFVSTPDLDFGNDIIEDTAQDEIVEQMLASPSANKVSLFHKREGEAPIGRVVAARKVQHEGKNKSWAKIMLNRDHPQFKSVVNMIRNGFIDASSIEYQAKSWVHKLIGNTMVRVVSSINMLGFALTGRPMNPNARIQNFYVKSFDMEVDKKAWAEPMPDKEVDIKVKENKNKEDDIMNTETKVDEKVETETKEEISSKEIELTKSLEQKDVEMKEMKVKLDKLEAEKTQMQVETKEVELLKKEIEALKVEGKVLVEQKEKAASEHKAIETEMKEYIEKPSWDKARELANKLF